jgi:hypothetical protein
MTGLLGSDERRRHWVTRMSEFLPTFLEEHPALSRFHREASIVFHGSTMMGIDDDASDLDFWLLLPAARMGDFDAASESRFISLTCDGKEGHLNAESVEEFAARVDRCDMDALYQLRNAVVMSDNTDRAEDLIALARRPMRKEVADAFFFYHYVEMRGEHRACDGPMERTDPMGVLLSLPKTIAHALRAAMVLDGEPYPYDKWLHRAAVETPTGAALGPHIDAILDRLAENDLRFEGPESANPIGRELRVIRLLLIEAAEAKGNNAPWLRRWWMHMTQARDAIRDVRW